MSAQSTRVITEGTVEPVMLHHRAFQLSAFLAALSPLLTSCTEVSSISSDASVDLALDGDPGHESSSEDVLDDPSTNSVSSSASELSGNVSYSGEGSPFMIAQWERGHAYARALLRSPAFAQCVSQTMRQPRPADGSAGLPGAPRYLACVDPLSTTSISTQVNRVLSTLETFNNDLKVHFEPEDPANSAAGQGHATYDSHGITINGGYHESLSDWTIYAGAEPWNYRVGDSIHEFMHTHEYFHLDDEADCTSQCGESRCRWTRVCGGSGTPPSSMNQANAGPAGRNYCSWSRLGDDRHYMSMGEPSAVYIVDFCAGNLMNESQRVCAGVTSNSSCGTGELRLLSSWTGVAETTQPATTSCGCHADPRHVVAFETSANTFLTAWEGGGSNVRTRVSNRLGPWQTFFAIDLNGRTWLAHEDVQLKAFAGNWVDFDFDADRSSPWNVRIGHPSSSSSTALGDGVTVAIRSGANYARDDGTELVPRSTSSGAGTNESFTLREFDRSRYITYLISDHGTHVRASTTGRLWNDFGQSIVANLSYTNDPLRRAAGFRLIDWNGGTLRSGDTVSLESMIDDEWRYLSVGFSSTGQIQLAHSVAVSERFIIRKVSGSPGSTIDHDDIVSFRSYNSNYISAMPSADGWTLTNAGTWEGPWQRFNLRLVQHHDRARPTW